MKDVKKSRNVGIKGGVHGKGLTTAPSKAHVAAGPAKKLGLGPDSVKSPTKRSAGKAIARVPVSKLRVAVIGGDDGQLFYRFTAADRTYIATSKEVVGAKGNVGGILTRIGILATSKDDRATISALVDEAKEDPNAVVATRVGFERSERPRYFVYGDGAVITPIAGLQVHPFRSKRNRFERKGKLRVYEEGIAKVIRNQPIPIAVFFYSLTQVVKPFVAATGFKAENMMFELVGETSAFKSALTCTLAGSIWGKAQSPDGYARTWNMSDQNIEELFREFNDHLLILDEATLAQTNDKARAERILNTVHRLSSGQGRDRPDEEAESHSVAMLSNSNQPIRSILPATDEVCQALEVRLISFAKPDRETGFFKDVPRAFGSVPTAMQHVFDVTRDHYGLLARRFIMNVLTLVQTDTSRLTELLTTAMKEFIEEVELGTDAADRVNYRRVQPFALAYATALLAFETKTLRREHWGNVEYSIRRAWLDHALLDAPLEGDARFSAYMTDPSNAFIDLRNREKPEMSDEAFKDIAGFIYSGDDGTLRMAVPSIGIKKIGYSAAVLKTLKQEKVLVAKKNLQTKRKFRKVGGQEKRDAFYIFVIERIPSGIRYWDGSSG